MRGVTSSMGQVVRGMDKAMETMNLEKVSGEVVGRRREGAEGSSLRLAKRDWEKACKGGRRERWLH